MKFDLSERRQRRIKAEKDRQNYLESWRPKFALWPIKVAPNQYRWLETVYVRTEFFKVKDFSLLGGWFWRNSSINRYMSKEDYHHWYVDRSWVNE